MRELTGHKVNECNDGLIVRAVDEPGHGGACHVYEIEWPDCVVDPPGCGHQGGNSVTVSFQNGPIKEVGTNGITHEALLAILIDRLRSFQNGAPGELALTAKGPFACRENAIALTKLEEAAHWLQHRTRGRLARGVEGTHEK